MTNTLPNERSASLTKALSQAKNYLQRQHIHFELEPYGKEPVSYICTLYQNGEKISSGGGKGATSTQSQVSAIFEAIEHSALNPCFIEEKMVLRPASEIFKSSWYNDIPFSLLSECIDNIMCIPYQHTENSEVIYLPVALINPSYIEAEEGYPAYRSFTSVHREGDNFDYSALIKYSTTNGISAGTTIDECLIHSVSEIIERYTLGEFIITLVALEHMANYTRVNPKSLPDSLHILYQSCCRELHAGEVHILNITSPKWGLPVYLVYLDHPEPAFRTFSAGASMDPLYALERALTEMLQRRAHPHSILNEGQDNARATMVRWYEKEYGEMIEHRTMCHFNITTLKTPLSALPAEDFTVSSPLPDRQNLHDYRLQLINKVKQAGGEVYWTHLINEYDLHVCSCFIYPFEPAFILASGRLISLTRDNLRMIKQIREEQHAHSRLPTTL
ncbi:YcaO-like family protein [Escherichia coli]|uniref:YcaO-like family protein n=1 Tax=Escherichia coli TaxID=562 RepID=UPI00234CD72E|nr:YcaO-like family protein [Escherichia coli]MDC6759047.1 YcaO-like family protein [Escherichia coli]